MPSTLVRYDQTEPSTARLSDCQNGIFFTLPMESVVFIKTDHDELGKIKCVDTSNGKIHYLDRDKRVSFFREVTVMVAK